jgi:hypothetical protein
LRSNDEPFYYATLPAALMVSLLLGCADKSDDNAPFVETTSPTMAESSMAQFPFEPGNTGTPMPSAKPEMAEDGQQFCRADLALSNIGKVPLTSSHVITSETLLISSDGNQYKQDDLSESVTDALMNRLHASGQDTGWFAGKDLNPGRGAVQVAVWQVPADETFGVQPTGRIRAEIAGCVGVCVDGAI